MGPKDPLAVGDHVLERYRVLEKLAVGGHSVVYRGEDERLSRPVCIKVFHRIAERDGVWQTSYEHFVQEAFALSKLTHPNTLRIYDFGHLADNGGDRGPPFQVSEFMNGGTLSTAVRLDGPLDGDEAVRIIGALCGALAEAHQHGIVHRDIKPKNILFGIAGPNRTVKLADFGIAKSSAVDDDAWEFRAGDTSVIAGRPLMLLSPSWAAPEQVTGDPITPATDVYSMALIAAYALTGRTVFASADTDDTYRMRARSDEQIDAAVDGSDLPIGVVALIKQSCSIEPSDRPATIEEFGRAFAAAMGGDFQTRAPTHLTPVPAEPPGEDRPRQPAPPPQPLRLSQGPQHVGDRSAIFVGAPGGVADLTGAHGAVRVRVTLLPARDRYCVHLKGLNCFVSVDDGRPSPASQLYESGVAEFVLPNRQRIAGARIDVGSPAAGHSLFQVGGRTVAVSVDECQRAVAVDFGSGAEVFIVYEQRATTATSASRGDARRPRRSTKKP